MISLVIISLVVAAFTPIITKKMQDKTESERTGSVNQEGEDVEMLKAKYADMFMPFSAVANKRQTTSEGGYFKCNQIITNSSTKERTITCQVKIPSDHVSIVMVGAGGGGSGAKVMKLIKNGGCGNFNLPTQKNFRVSFGDYGIKASQGGYVYRIENEPGEERYIKECPKETEEVLTGYGDIYCITKYNVRPSKMEDYHFNTINPKTWYPETDAMTKEIKVDMPEGVMLRDSGYDSEYTYILNNKAPACWVGPSSSSCTMQNDYSICGRTYCNGNAADIMCQEVTLGDYTCSDDGIHFDKPCKGKWRLMSRAELQAGSTSALGNDYHLHSIIAHNYKPLFSENTANVLNIGGVSSSTCAGASSLKCSNDLIGINTDGSSRVNSGSVRCVLQKAKGKQLYTYITGGQGGKGVSMKDLKIPLSVIEYCRKDGGCKSDFEYEEKPVSEKVNLFLFPDKFGLSKDGADGQNLIGYIKDSNGKILWRYKIEGGKAGKGAVFNAPGDNIENAIPGKGGEGGKLCWKYNVESSSWSEPFDCETEKDGVGIHGENGEDGRTIAFHEFGVLDSIPLSSNASASVFSVPYPNFISFNNSGSGGWSSADFSCNSDYVSYGGSGAGGGGGAFIHIKDIPITSNKEYKVIIGGGGAGSKFVSNNSSNIGVNGGNTMLYLDDNTVITASGGAGAGKVGDGIDAVYGSGGVLKMTSDSSAIQALFKDEKKVLKADGTNGTSGSRKSDEQTALNIGGSGGMSGISVTTKVLKNAMTCGGLFEDSVSGCANKNNVDATGTSYLTNLHAPVKHIFIDGNYGSYGAGGGGGGAKYENDVLFTGNGSDGQDGYIYFYWKK